MKPRICICCGEPMAKMGGALSRNPNVCASCSSLADGMEETNLPVPAPETSPGRQPIPVPAEILTFAQ